MTLKKVTFLLQCLAARVVLKHSVSFSFLWTPAALISVRLPGTQTSIVTHSPSCKHFVRSYMPVSRESAPNSWTCSQPLQAANCTVGLNTLRSDKTSDFVSQPKRLRSPIVPSSRPFKYLTLWPFRREWQQYGGLNGPGIESRWRWDFSTPSKHSESHPASYTKGTGPFHGVKRPARGVDHPLFFAPGCEWV